MSTSKKSATKVAKSVNANVAKATKSSTRNAAKAAEATPKGVKSTTTSNATKVAFDPKAAALRLASFKKDAKKAKAAYQQASESLQKIQYAAHKCAADIAHNKFSNNAELTSEERVLHWVDAVSIHTNQCGIDKAYSFVDEFLSSLREETKAAKETAKSLNAAVRNLLADWAVFEPIFNALGIKKADVKPSLLQSASPFLMLPTAEGCRVGAITRRVKRDAKGNPLKVDDKKQYTYGLKAVTAWDAWTFTSMVVTIELSNKNKVFDAAAEEKHKLFLDNAVESLKALQTEKEAAKAARLAAKAAREDAAKAAYNPAKQYEFEQLAKANDAKAKSAAKAASKARKQTKRPLSKVGKSQEAASAALAAAKKVAA